MVAEAAVLLLRPRGLLEPLDAAPRAYFSAEQIEKGQHFRNGQLVLYVAQTAVQLAVLVVIARRPPRWLLTARRRQVLTGAAAAAGLSIATTLATLPLGVIARQRAKDVGLVTQDWVGYAGDLIKSTGIGAVLAAAGGALLVFALRRFGRRWWAPAAVVVVAFGIVSTYLAPIVLDPLFNKFTPLPAGETRSTVFDLARRAGVSVKQVYEVDASRRTSAANAYVNGIGHTKRVVIYDNLLNKFTPEETKLVVAHELGHVHYNDVPHGLLYLAIVAPFGMFAVARIGERVAPRGAPPAAAVPAVVLAIAIMMPAITFISNQLSRGVEQRADQFSLGLTHDPKPFIDFQRQISIQNVGDPDPPAFSQFLLGTHPTTMQRIGLALRY